MNDTHSPHLAPNEIQAFDYRVGEAVKGNLVGPTGVVGRVGLLFDPLIPVVAIAIEGSCTMSIDTDVVSAEYERSGLVLVADCNGMIEPVIDICTPL